LLAHNSLLAHAVHVRAPRPARWARVDTALVLCGCARVLVMLVCDSVLVGRACWVLSVFVCGCCQAVSNIVCTSYVFRPRSTHTGAPRARARARVARLGCVGFVCGAGARVLRVCAGRACKLCFPVDGKECACAMRAQRVGTPTRVGGRFGTAMLLCGDACVLLVLVCDRVLVGCTSCAGVCVRIVRVWALSSGS
jgi:hypothetical protein